MAAGWEQFRRGVVVPPARGAGEEPRRGGGVRGHYAAEESARSVAASQGGCRSGEPREKRFSGKYEPRDSHANERDIRNDHAGAGNQSGCGTARLSEHGEEFGGIAADTAERHSG